MFACVPVDGLDVDGYFPHWGLSGRSKFDKALKMECVCELGCRVYLFLGSLTARTRCLEDVSSAILQPVEVGD